MKLREVLNRVKNSNNGQSVWNPKKRKLKELDISEEDILDMDMDKFFKRSLK